LNASWSNPGPKAYNLKSDCTQAIFQAGRFQTLL
jgi:hypothetical protein